MSRRPVIGVMGAGDGARTEDIELAESLGEMIARQGWILLTGGRDRGVMEAAGRGAKRMADSIVIGILPGESQVGVSRYVDVAIFTGMGNARNAINVLSSDVVVACRVTGPGTASEVCLALKSDKPVVLLRPTEEAEKFFLSISKKIHIARSVAEAIKQITELLNSSRGWNFH